MSFAIIIDIPLDSNFIKVVQQPTTHELIVTIDIKITDAPYLIIAHSTLPFTAHDRVKQISTPTHQHSGSLTYLKGNQ